MRQKQASETATVDEVMSDWWDDELSGDGRWADTLLEHDDAVREKARLYELIGSRVRGEASPSRDLLAGISAGLDRLSHGEASGADVISLDAARYRRRRLIPAAMAASLVAGLAAVGLSLTVNEPAGPAGSGTLQATAPTANDRTLMATLGGAELPESASPVGMNIPEATVARVERSPADSDSRLPAWASGSVAPDSDPYVINHYRAASSEFGSVVPEVRAAAFERQ